MRYKITIQYHGPSLQGWQRQKTTQNTVHQHIVAAFKKLLKIENITLYGAGRTDAGVHALYQVAHLDVETDLFEKFKIKNNHVCITKSNKSSKICNGVNFHLKKTGVQIINIEEVSDLFHARYSAKKRVYKYIIYNNYYPDIINEKKAWHVKKPIDIEVLKNACSLFIGTYDFKNFAKSGEEKTLRSIDKIKVEKNNKYISIYISAESFIRNQIRYIVGSVISVSTREIDKSHIQKLLQLKSDKKIKPAPPFGLYLYNIIY